MDTTTTSTMSAREQILNDYTINSSSMITSPGKFEGEPIFAPYYWENGLNGMADEDNGETFTFDLTADDYAMWPELRDWMGNDESNTLIMSESEQGFVTCR